MLAWGRVRHKKYHTHAEILVTVQMSNRSPGHGPCFEHHLSFHLSFGTALRTSTSGSASAPLVHGTCRGIGPCQISSETGHGHTLRGAFRIFSGNVVDPKCGSLSIQGVLSPRRTLCWNLSQHSPKLCLWTSKAKQRSSGQKVQMVQACFGLPPHLISGRAGHQRFPRAPGAPHVAAWALHAAQHSPASRSLKDRPQTAAPSPP